MLGIYVTLARDLKQQMQGGAPAARASLANALQTFLDQVSKRANQLNVLYWVAETFSELSSGLRNDGGKPSAEATALDQAAAETFQRILDLNKSGQLQVDPAALYHMRNRLAATWHRLGRYEEAIRLFQAILQDNDRRLDVQLAAALAYQDWGTTGQPQYLDRAVWGDAPCKDKQAQAIWGWAKLANVAAAQMHRGPEYKQKYGDVFHRARLSMATALYQKAMLPKATNRTETLQRAKAAITSTHALYPDMGGETWKPQYDRLLRQIQKELGEATGGLQRAGATAGTDRS